MNVDFSLPALGENVAGGDVVGVLVREGDVIAANDGVLEIETDKAVVEIPCPHAGKIITILVAKGQAVKVGQPVLTVETESVVAEASPAVAPAKPQAAAVQPAAAEEIPAGPEVRRLARELGVDLSRIKGAGRGGRITIEDVRAAADQRMSPGKPPARPSCPKRRPPESPPSAARASPPCRRACWAKTPTATSAASRCRGFAARSPRR